LSYNVIHIVGVESCEARKNWSGLETHGAYAFCEGLCWERAGLYRIEVEIHGLSGFSNHHSHCKKQRLAGLSGSCFAPEVLSDDTISTKFDDMRMGVGD